MVKVSVFIRKADVIWSYKGDFWKDVYARIVQTENAGATLHIGKGNFQHQFYFASEREAEYFRNLIKKIIADMVSGDGENKDVIVSAAIPDAAEISKLNETVEKTPENAAFWTAAEKLGCSAVQTPEIKKEKLPGEEIIRKTTSVSEENEASKPAPSVDKTEKTAEKAAPETLAEKAERIKALRKELLEKVKGQRHAVEVMVQSIFECEMFASRDPKRKGPLATFLFTGPSGVGKTFLATLCGEYLGRETLIVDMSEFSNNLSNSRFNGEHGQSAIVTGFARKNPNGIIIFDEIEKAHINTIHLFLQILDGGRLMDHNLKKEISFKDNIIIMTTNAGKELYDDTTVCDLSATPRNVIIDALKKDVNPQTGEAFFPECITTRMANGHVILFNHLEPYALMEIVRAEIAKQIGFFEESSGIRVEYNPEQLAALVLYNGGGVSDARTLRGLAKNIIVRELQEVIMQIYEKNPASIGELKTITLDVDVDDGDSKELFINSDKMYAAVLANESVGGMLRSNGYNTEFDVVTDADLFKRRVRGVTDFVLIDPLFGVEAEERVPNDVEDIESLGMQMFDYIREFSPEVPVYILDTSSSVRSFDTLLARGARGIIRAVPSGEQKLRESLRELAFGALINNSVYTLGRACKYLTFNCAQYIIDPTCAVVSFEKLIKKSAPQAGDDGMIAGKGGNNNIMFADVIGCKDAKEALSDYRNSLNNPRGVAVSGKQMPKGVLLYGPPGTGKTMLAKAMANECNATFFPVSATSFFAPLVGQTEQNIRDLFRKARKYAPSIIFVDEVDAIARQRTGSVSSVHNEDALTTFLAEMDGFVTDEKRPVFLLAATNYEIEGEGPTVLDRAFVRRFDRKILIPLPDTDERYQLLALSLKKHGIHFGEKHDEILRNMAERTAGMNNADLEKLNTEYVRILGDGEPDSSKYMDALDSYRYGEANKMDPAALRQTACHEAGHALVCRLCGEKPSFLTVVSRGNYGGYMLTATDDTKGNYTYDELMNRVCVSLAGRVAEIECYGESLGVNTGASSDIKHARYYIRVSLDDYAMGEKLFARWKSSDAEALMQKQYDRTVAMIREHKDALIRLTDLLAKEKCLDSRQMEDFFTSENI